MLVLSLPWSLLVGCNEKVSHSSGSGMHSVSVCRNPEENWRTVVIFWNEVSEKSEWNFYCRELSNFWERMSWRRRWAVENVAIGVFVLWGRISCRGQRHQLFTEFIAQIKQTGKSLLYLVPFRQCSAPCSMPLPCAVLSMKGREGDSGVCLLSPWCSRDAFAP